MLATALADCFNSDQPGLDCEYECTSKTYRIFHIKRVETFKAYRRWEKSVEPGALLGGDSTHLGGRFDMDEPAYDTTGRYDCRHPTVGAFCLDA